MTDKSIEWDEAWDEATIQLAHEEAAKLQPFYTQWSDAADAKVVTIFSVASVIVGFAPALNRGDIRGVGTYFWAIAIMSWVLVVVFCYLAYRPRDFRVDPNPKTLLGPAWLNLTPAQYRCFRLRDMGRTHEQNRVDLNRKSTYLGWAITFTAIEVFALALASLLGAV